MIKVHLIVFGRLKESFLREASAEYAKRLSRFCDLTVTELSPKGLPDSPSPAQIEAALAEEAEEMLRKIPAGCKTVALCVEGREQTSEAFARFLSENENSGTPVVFLIGSSYGLHEKVKKQADLRLSLSEMTFPHQLFRVMLLEQIYRGFQINKGGTYHK